MAEQQTAPPNIFPVHFPTLAKPWDPFSQRGTMGTGQDGRLWREMVNLQLRDGHLERRNGTTKLNDGGGGSYYSLRIPKATHTIFDGDGETDPKEQRILLVFDFDHWPEGVAEVGRLIITDKEIFLYHQGGTWTNVTPVYTSATPGVKNPAPGTLDEVTNGSKIVTGNATKWLDDGLCGGNAITLPDAENYEIDTVDSNTQITLVNNYGGSSTGSGASLDHTTIRVHTAVDNHVFAQYFNGNLYAGGHIGANVGSDGGTDSIILRWSNINQDIHTGSTADYVFQGAFDYDTGVCDKQDYFCNIKGFQMMSDGRIVVAGSYFDVVGSAGSGNARIWYSSHLNQQVWTLSPGGAFDIVSHQSEVTALGEISGGYSAHFMDGISMLVPTGLDDPPLAEYQIDSDVGAVGPRTLCNNGKAEFFIGRSWQLHVFDGASTEALSRVPRYVFDEVTVRELGAWGCADVDSHRGHYHALCTTRGPYGPGTGQPDTIDRFTRHLVTDFRTGDVWQYKWAFPIWNIYLSPLHAANDALNWSRSYALGLLGVSNYTNSAWDEDTTGILAILDSGATAGDPDPPPDSPTAGKYGGYYATTDDLDFGAPGQDKYPDHVTLWYSGSGTDVDIYCAVSRDGGATWDTETTQVTPTDEIQHYNFFFEKESAENWRIQIGLGDTPEDESQDWAGGVQFVKMTAWMVLEGEVEYYG